MRTPLLLSSLLALGVLPPLPKPRTQEDAARRERVSNDLVARGIDPEEVRAAEAEEAEALKVRSDAYKAAMAAGKFRPEATAAANAAEAMYLRAGRNHAGKTSGGVDWISEQAQALMSGGVLPDSIVMPSGTGPRITKADRNRQAQREARKVRKAAKARRGW